MSYQRPSDGRFYVWMGSDGLHIMHDPKQLADAKILHGAAGRDNAKAIARGLFDFLKSEGIDIKVKRGEPVFTPSKGARHDG